MTQTNYLKRLNKHVRDDFKLRFPTAWWKARDGLKQQARMRQIKMEWKFSVP